MTGRSSVKAKEVVYFLSKAVDAKGQQETANGTPLYALYRRQLVAVPDSSVAVGFQFRPGEPAIFPQIGEKMVLFLRAPSVPVKAYWSLIDVHGGAQPYSEALENTVRKLVAQQY